MTGLCYAVRAMLRYTKSVLGSVRRAVVRRLWPQPPAPPPPPPPEPPQLPAEAQANFWRSFEPGRATFNAGALDPLAVSRALRRYGCVLIRGLFDPAELARFDARIMRNLEGIPQDQLGHGVPLYFAGNDSRDEIQRAFRQNYPALFVPEQMAGLDCVTLPRYVFRRLQTVGLDALLARLLGLDRLCTSASICHIRYFDPPPLDQIAKRVEGLEFHQDNKLYQMRAELFTLWLPFRYEHGTMPSLEFLPIRPRGVLPTVTACGIARDSFPQSRFWSPHYQLGDAMILSGYAPHRTYYPPNVSKGRTSIDFRFFPSKVPSPIYGQL
jgi:hypothetical protein